MSGPLRQKPLILDFDGSVLPVSDEELRIPLHEWQEDIRFGASPADYARLRAYLRERLPSTRGPVFTGSGDYHHLTLLLLQNLAQRQILQPDSLDLVVCDNHPDNMRYLFGLHCGSWVRHAALLPCIRHVHVIGVTSDDIGIRHAWENYLSPFVRKKLTYWSVKTKAGWLSLIGRKAYGRCFSSADALVNAFLPVLRASRSIYLSIDKDVLLPDVARTTWDQGVFDCRHLEAVISACRERLIGTDITGDVSAYAFTGCFKRFLIRLEGQTPFDAEKMDVWRKSQQRMNRKILAALEGGMPEYCPHFTQK
ncbi:hypothetical protein FACS1894206_05970 [Deltaproteobacteria bacterium]|nr:hypothetical protein FACS1894206_05970 [Deltaproteobacteria bacterium]